MQKKIDEIKNISKDVQLVAVTKTVDVQTIEKAVEYGVTDIGENRVQDLVRKMELLTSKPRIHFIGRLQTNKVKYLVGKVYLIQSVDRIRLAKKIDEEAKKRNVIQNILIQVNASKEENKAGFFTHELDDTVSELSKLDNIKVLGFMFMAPHIENTEKLAEYFKKMNKIFDYYKNTNYNNMYIKYLSMGMSNDYKVAIENGSNMIRIGSAIFQGEEK